MNFSPYKMVMDKQDNVSVEMIFKEHLNTVLHNVVLQEVHGVIIFTLILSIKKFVIVILLQQLFHPNQLS